MTDKFIFQNLDQIGVADAESDKNVLLQCFVETGDYDVLSDMERPERFVLGRTGAGKTALITRLSNEAENVITINPEGLALGHISNSTIIKFLVATGIDLDLFFRLLWRHVLVVEVLKRRFNIQSPEDNRSMVDRLTEKFRYKPHHQRAIKYLREWGDKFWLETDSRVIELTKKFEEDINASIESASPWYKG